MEKLLTVKEAAKESGYNPGYLCQLCRDKKVAHVRRGGRYFFSADDMARLTVHVEPIADGEGGVKG